MHSENYYLSKVLGVVSSSLSPALEIELLVWSWLHIYCELPRPLE